MDVWMYHSKYCVIWLLNVFAKMMTCASIHENILEFVSCMDMEVSV